MRLAKTVAQVHIADWKSDYDSDGGWPALETGAQATFTPLRTLGGVPTAVGTSGPPVQPSTSGTLPPLVFTSADSAYAGTVVSSPWAFVDGAHGRIGTDSTSTAPRPLPAATSCTWASHAPTPNAVARPGEAPLVGPPNYAREPWIQQPVAQRPVDARGPWSMADQFTACPPPAHGGLPLPVHSARHPLAYGQPHELPTIYSGHTFPPITRQAIVSHAVAPPVAYPRALSHQLTAPTSSHPLPAAAPPSDAYGSYAHPSVYPGNYVSPSVANIPCNVTTSRLQGPARVPILDMAGVATDSVSPLTSHINSKLINVALSGEFVELFELLDTKNDNSHELKSVIDSNGNVSFKSIRSRRCITSPYKWLEAWGLYEIILGRVFGYNITHEMISYRNSILGLFQRFKVAHVLNYDSRHRHRLAAY